MYTVDLFEVTIDFLLLFQPRKALRGLEQTSVYDVTEVTDADVVFTPPEPSPLARDKYVDSRAYYELGIRRYARRS